MITDQGVWKCVIRAPEDLYSSVVVLIQVLIWMRWQYCDTVSNIIMLNLILIPYSLTVFNIQYWLMECYNIKSVWCAFEWMILLTVIIIDNASCALSGWKPADSPRPPAAVRRTDFSPSNQEERFGRHWDTLQRCVCVCACVRVQNLTPKYVPAFILFILFFCFAPLRQQDWVSDPEGWSGPEFSVSEGWRRTLPWRFSRVHDSTRDSRFSFFFSNFFIPFILYPPFLSCTGPLDATGRRSKIFIY